MEVLLLVAGLVVLAVVGCGGYFGYAKCLTRTQKPGLSVLVGFLCALGCFLVLAGLAFGACLCALGNMKG